MGWTPRSARRAPPPAGRAAVAVAVAVARILIGMRSGLARSRGCAEAGRRDAFARRAPQRAVQIADVTRAKSMWPRVTRSVGRSTP
ncbi:hypothetical protein FAGKG844_20216 [Frankia sp. AgKG'84/4]